MEPAIKMAEKKLDFLSSDPETLEIYKAREYSLHERANMINSAKQEKAIEIARGLMGLLPIEVIAEKTGLLIQEIEKLR